MLKIELFNPETEKKETYTENFVSARSLRKVVEFGIKQESGEMTELEVMDETVALVADLFRDSRVTYDSIYDGIAADKIGDVLTQVLMDVMGGQVKKKMAEQQKK